MHRGGGPDDLVDRAAAAGRQRSTDHGHDARARGQRIAPRPADGHRDVSHAGRCTDGRRRAVQFRRAKRHQMGGRIPGDELRFQRLPGWGDDRDVVFTANRSRRRDNDVGRIHDATGRLPPAVNLNDRRHRGSDGIGKLVGKIGECCLRHGRHCSSPQRSSTSPVWGVSPPLLFDVCRGAHLGGTDVPSRAAVTPLNWR